MARDNFWKLENGKWVDTSYCESCINCSIHGNRAMCILKGHGVRLEWSCPHWRPIKDYPMTCIKCGRFLILTTNPEEIGLIKAGTVVYRVGKRMIGNEMHITVFYDNTYYEIPESKLYEYFKGGCANDEQAQEDS